MNEIREIIQDKINEQNDDDDENKIKDESYKKDSPLLPVNVLHLYIKQFQKSVCKIKIEDVYGTGILLELKKGEETIYGLITCEHVIEQKLIDKKENIEINYNFINNTCKNITIKLDESKRFIRNYRYLNIDITVLQIYLEEIEKNCFLKTFFLEKKQIENLKNKIIYIFQFPYEANELQVSYGNFISSYSSNRFIHSAKASSGATIFNFIEGNPYLIGINKGGTENTNFGYFLNPVINSLKENAYYTKKKEVIGGLFEGEYLPGNKQIGTFEKSKDEKYIGELLHFIPNGIGILYKNNQILYQGRFVKGNYEGEGKLFYEDGTYYEGQFINNKKHGRGILYNSNKSQKYKGSFVNDNYEGEGKLFNEDGTYYEGQFVDNKRHGKGKLYNKKGKIIFEGDFNNDTYEKEKEKNNEEDNEENNEGDSDVLGNLANEETVDQLGDEILSCLKPLGTKLNVNYSCGNCNCSTEYHDYNSETHVWHCRKCNSDCKNRVSQFVKGILKMIG